MLNPMPLKMISALSILWAIPLAQQGPQRVDFCDLLNQPESFDGRIVTLRASYRYGFEWQELFCYSCRGAPKVWLEFQDDLPKAAERALKRMPTHAGTVNATFTGVFRGQESAYGDGGYKYQLEVCDLSDVVTVSKSLVAPEMLPEAEKKRLWHCTGTVAGLVEGLSDSDLIKALSSSDIETASRAVKEVVLRGARMAPLIASLRGNQQPYPWGSLGPKPKKVPVDDRVTLELLGLYLLMAIYNDMEFPRSPYLIDLTLPAKERAPSKKKALIDRGWRSAARWIAQLREESIEKLRSQNKSPLSDARIAFW